MTWKHRQLKDVNCVVVIGAILAIVGLAISLTDWLPFLNYIFAPRYVAAQSGLAKLQEKDAILTKEDPGFSEIVELLKENITGNRVPIITQIKTVTWGQAVVDIQQQGSEWQKYNEFELSFSNGKPTTGKFYQLESRIRQEYLDHNKALWGSVISLVGIGLVLFDAFFEKKVVNVSTEKGKTHIEDSNA